MSGSNIVSKYRLESDAKICEIAYIAGQLEEQRLIKLDGDLEEVYKKVYVATFMEFINPTTEFKDEEERLYISKFAYRRLIELYSV